MIEFKDLAVKLSDGSLVSFSKKMVNGNIYGIFGDSVDGRSLILSLLTGDLSPDKGDVRINGFSMQKDKDRAKKHVGVLLQPYILPPKLTVTEWLTFVADSYGMHYNKALRRISELLNEWGLLEKRTRTIEKLTPSEQRVLCFLTLLLPDLEFYLLELLTTLSDRERHDITLFLNNIPEGKTVFLATDDTILLKAHCFEVFALENGTLLDMPMDGSIAFPSRATAPDRDETRSPKKKIGSILTEGVTEEILDGEEGG